MFAPTKVWRKLHHRVPVGQRRFAMVTAIAATGPAALVQARGHAVASVPELPLVISGECKALTRTKQAARVLKGLGLWADVTRAKDSRTVRAGHGKMRNRYYVARRGPIVVYAGDQGITRAFRNVPGVIIVID